MKTKEKIIQTSIELFNRQGVVAITTNHIAKELNMSPGNLYFHFANKEEIIRQIFKNMCKETYQIWQMSKKKQNILPLDLIEKNFELFWKYRFFHREMHYLRRKDPQLSKMWKIHLVKIKKLMMVMHRRWVKEGWIQPIQSGEEAEFVSNVLLSTSSTFFQFFESSERLPVKKHVESGKKYMARILVPWTSGSMRSEFDKFITHHLTQ